MALTDHFERRALLMVGFQLLVGVGVLVYGLVSPSLGSHLVWSGLALFLWLGAFAWLTLTRPWGGGFSAGAVLGAHQDGRWFQRRWNWSEPAGLILMTLGLARGFVRVFGDVKDQLRDWASHEPRTLQWVLDDVARKAYEADAYGSELVSGPQVFATLVVPAFLAFLLWFLLPR